MITLSTIEAGYILVASCCSQILWIKNQLEDYGHQYSKIPILCEKKLLLVYIKNLILHPRAKHIEIKHHYICDYVQKRINYLEYVNTKEQIVYIFTKPLVEERFKYLGNLLGMTFVE